MTQDNASQEETLEAAYRRLSDKVAALTERGQLAAQTVEDMGYKGFCSRGMILADKKIPTYLSLISPGTLQYVENVRRALEWNDLAAAERYVGILERHCQEWSDDCDAVFERKRGYDQEKQEFASDIERIKRYLGLVETELSRYQGSHEEAQFMLRELSREIPHLHIIWSAEDFDGRRYDIRSWLTTVEGILKNILRDAHAEHVRILMKEYAIEASSDENLRW